MVRGEEVANQIVNAVAVKIGAVENIGRGFYADGNVYDRLMDPQT